MKLRKGFTLIELLVVVAIIGILVTIAVPRFASMTQGAKRATWQANHQEIVSAISMYIADNDGKMPTVDQDLDQYITGADSTNTAVHNLQGKPASSTYIITYNLTDPITGAPTVKLESHLDGETNIVYNA